MMHRYLVPVALTLGAAAVPACTCGPRGAVPTVASVEPAWGPTEGGTSVVISGENFGADVTVRFGGAPAIEVTRMDSRTLSARTPPGFGLVSVQVENPGNHVGTLDGAFEYRGQIFCTVSSSTPNAADGEVPIVGELTVEWSHPLLPASLESNVRLRRLGPDAADVPATVEPQGDRAVSIRPETELRFWHSYSILVGDGVRDSAGQPCAPSAIPFSTVEPAVAPRALRAAPVNGALMVGNHLVIASRDYRGLQVYDVSDPALVALAADLPTRFSPIGLSSLGETAYAPLGWDGVSVFDVTDPRMPAEIGRGGTPGFASDVAPFTRGGRTYLAVADGKEGVRLLDATDPASIVSVGVIDPSGARDADVRAVAIQDDLIAIADGARGFAIAVFQDADEPSSTSIVSRVEFPGIAALDVAWHGSILYVARGYYGVQAYDTSDPADPVLRGIGYGPGGQCTTGCTDYMHQLVVDGDEVLAAAWGPGVFRFAGDGAGDLTLVDLLPSEGPASAAVAGSSHLFVGAEEGLVVFDRAAVDAAPIWSSPEGHGLARGVVVIGEYAYAAASFRGLQTFSLADPQAPALIDRDDTPGMQRDVAAFDVEAGPDGVLVLADGRAGITLFDVSSPDDPTQLSNLETQDRTAGMSVDGDVLYACDDNGGVAVISLSDPSSPTKIAELLYSDLAIPDQCYDVLVVDDDLYVAGRVHLARADISNPSSPQWIDNVARPPGEYARSLARSGDFLFVTTSAADFEGTHGETGRVEIFQGVNAGAPSLAWRSDNLGNVPSISVIGTKAFVSAGPIGIYVFDASTPGQPVLEGVIETRGNAVSVARGAGVLYAASVGGGLETVVTGPLP